MKNRIGNVLVFKEAYSSMLSLRKATFCCLTSLCLFFTKTIQSNGDAIVLHLNSGIEMKLKNSEGFNGMSVGH
jgi:hypothetical protein